MWYGTSRVSPHYSRCILAAAVTFPLSFGWIHFETAGAAQERYQSFVFGVRVFTFDLASPLAPLVFNVLDISVVLVMIGVSPGDVAAGPRPRRPCRPAVRR